MYPDTIFNWIDNSYIQVATEPDYYQNAPLYLVASSFDMGPEELQVVYGQKFFDLYGSKMNFAKHGQPALQAANDITNGAKLLLKRIVAPDSTLANVILLPNLTKSRVAEIAEDPTDPKAVTYEQAVAILNGEEYIPEESIVKRSTVQNIIDESRAVSRALSNNQLYDVKMDMVIDTESVPIIPDPTTGLNSIDLTSQNGSYDGFTIIKVDPEKSINNVYLYKLVANKEDIVFPALAENCVLEKDGGEYNVWNGEEIKIPDGYKYIIMVEAQVESATSNLAVAAGAVYLNPKDQTMYLIQEPVLTVKWTALSVTGCKKHSEVADKARELETENRWIETDEETGSLVLNESITLPLITISDNGRGKSSKSVKFTPDYVVSRTNTNMFYNIQVYNKGTRLEKGLHTINPYCIIDNKSYGIGEDASEQVVFDFADEYYDKYFAFISEALDIDETTLKKYDIIYGTTNTGNPLPGFIVDPESIDLDSAFGVELQNGTDGAFEEVAFGTDEYIEEAVSFFEGEVDDSIWDQDLYKISAIFDANYPEPIKDAIVKFVDFRADCAYFRDYGIGVFSYYDIYDKAKTYQMEAKVNRFTADYYTTYMIYDPETKRKIRTTMMYDFSECMINHFRDAYARPIAGIANNMILKSAIEGTVNFTPRKTPKVNQKQLLDDLRVNYAIFNNSGQCIVNTLYSSQLEYTQLSYVCNVLAIQAVMRLVRETCPRQRYTFVTGSDFSTYQKAVTNVLNQVQDEFEQLTFDYEQDEMLAAQKIFYGIIYFRFRNWAQTEKFDLYALPVTIEQ